MSRISLSAVFFIFPIILTSCASAPQVTRNAEPVGIDLSISIEEATAEDLAVDSSEYLYKLSISDELEVRYLQRLEYSTDVKIGPDGAISLPFLPLVKAAGLTLEELTYQIEQRYRELRAYSPAPGSKRYLVGVGDVLEIKFPFIEQYSGTVRVRPDGRISLPLITSVIAEGKSPEELSLELIQLFEEQLNNPELVLNVVSSNSNNVISNGEITRIRPPNMDSVFVRLRTSVEPKVYVGGEVVSPQAILFEPKLSSLQAIFAAGGLTSKSELQNVIILRKGVDGNPKYIVRNLKADLDGDVISDNNQTVVTNDILLRPFDVIIVPKTKIAKVSDTLDSYLYDLFPMLRNSSIGFNYQVGTMRIEQDTNIINSTED